MDGDATATTMRGGGEPTCIIEEIEDGDEVFLVSVKEEGEEEEEEEK